ncbi:hypothetical protein PLESTB_001629800, partial [Pleodorina starrii]
RSASTAPAQRQHSASTAPAQRQRSASTAPAQRQRKHSGRENGAGRQTALYHLTHRRTPPQP